MAEVSTLAKNSNSSTFGKQSQHSLLRWLNSLDSALFPAQHLRTSSYFKENNTRFLFYLLSLYISVKYDQEVHYTKKKLSHSLLSVLWTSGQNVSPLLCSVVTAGEVRLIVLHHSNAQWDYITGNHNKGIILSHQTHFKVTGLFMYSEGYLGTWRMLVYDF